MSDLQVEDAPLAISVKSADGRWSAELNEAGATCSHADGAALALLAALLRSLEDANG
jgi:hypothetical protein